MASIPAEVLKNLLLTLTSGDDPTVEVTWEPGAPESPIHDGRPARLVVKHRAMGPIYLYQRDGLTVLLQALGQKLQISPTRRQFTISRHGDRLRIAHIQ